MERRGWHLTVTGQAAVRARGLPLTRERVIRAIGESGP
jgi:hypothetical protein